MQNSESDGQFFRGSLNADQRTQFKQEVIGGRPYADRISVVFATRLVCIANKGLGYHEVLNEVDYLEGMRSNSRTKPAAEFTGSVLQGFWHKHFCCPRHIVKNIGIRWALDRNGNRDLDHLLKSLATKGEDNWIGELSYRIVIDGYTSRARAGRLTGDWIIFAKHDELNYYLDLATHDEGRNAEQLMEKLRLGNEAEFPFLFRM